VRFAHEAYDCGPGHYNYARAVEILTQAGELSAMPSQKTA
jgi:hypothetical protein